jgi:hypothetical protein
LLERKKLLRSIIPREPFCIGYVGCTDRQPERLFEIIKANDLEGLVVKRKDGRYRPQTKWYKVLNPSYSQRIGRADLFQCETAPRELAFLATRRRLKHPLAFSPTSRFRLISR